MDGCHGERWQHGTLSAQLVRVQTPLVTIAQHLLSEIDTVRYIGLDAYSIVRCQMSSFRRCLCDRSSVSPCAGVELLVHSPRSLDTLCWCLYNESNELIISQQDIKCFKWLFKLHMNKVSYWINISYWITKQ